MQNVDEIEYLSLDNRAKFVQKLHAKNVDEIDLRLRNFVFLIFYKIQMPFNVITF